MKDEPDSDPGLWIGPQDELGRPRDKAILEAAQRNWKRVQAYAERQGQDSSVAAEVLERVVGALCSLKMRRPDSYAGIKSLDTYLFWAAAWRINKLVAKSPLLEYMGSLDDLSVLGGMSDFHGTTRVELKILMKEVHGFMSEQMRLLMFRRDSGFTWPEIAESLGVPVPRLRVQFSEGLAAVRKRILGTIAPKPAPRPIGKGRNDRKTEA